MTATNHALSGALIGLAITQPILAIPLAFVSHFVLDAIPHFGLDELGGHLKARRYFHKILLVDALLLSVVFLILLAAGAPLLVFVCAIAAGSPDLIWAYQYVYKGKFGKLPESKKNRFDKFHSDIQKSQTQKGLFVELPLAVTLSIIILNML